MKKLFIIGFLLLNFRLSFAQEITKETEQKVWNFIHNNFVAVLSNGGTYTDTYPRDIAIKLEGDVSREDSTCVSELAEHLKTLIPGVKIYFTPGAVCLVFNFTNKQQPAKRAEGTLGSIYFRKTFVVIPKDASNDLRRKIIYYNFYRSLVVFKPFDGINVRLAGCVFDEEKPENITYSPIDDFIVKKMYVRDFWTQYNDWLKKESFFTFYKRTHQYQWGLTFSLSGFIIGFGLISLLLIKGVLRMRRRTWWEYNRIGIIIIGISTLALYLKYLDNFYLNDYEISTIIQHIIQMWISINIIYFLERYYYKINISGGTRLTLVFVTTFSILWLVSMVVVQNQNFSWRFNYGVIYFIAAVLRTVYIFLNDKYNSMINKKDVQLARINELHKRVQLQTLQAKINPHFLYNALNSIASLATTDAKKTEQMALSLSDFFKYSINREQKQLNSLSEELNAIRTYLEIEKVRFGERLNYEIDCPAELLNIQIPQLLVQPLVENAVKHGLSQITGKGLIKISVSKVGEEIKIRVDDNGPAFPDGPLTGYGIKNTNERIRLMYGKKASINWYNGEEKCIELSFPIA